MDDLTLLIDLHRGGWRQGPGGAAETRRAIELSGLTGRPNLTIADMGCGTGAATLVLAEALDADIIAVDFAPAFLRELEQRAERAGLGARIRPLCASMEDLIFEPQSLDAIWAEGAIYNLGFAEGVRRWRRFVKPGGVLAVSELTFLTRERPAELTEHWVRAYPEVDTAAAKIAVLEGQGYEPLGYFSLPQTCWLDAYYRPLQERFAAFLTRHAGSDAAEAAQALVAAEQAEIALYERFAAYISYGFYIARIPQA